MATYMRKLLRSYRQDRLMFIVSLSPAILPMAWLLTLSLVWLVHWLFVNSA
jgi:hypothetical protein